MKKMKKKMMKRQTKTRRSRRRRRRRKKEQEEEEEEEEEEKMLHKNSVPLLTSGLLWHTDRFPRTCPPFVPPCRMPFEPSKLDKTEPLAQPHPGARPPIHELATAAPA